MANATTPADAGVSSNASTPTADAALAGVPTGGGAEMSVKAPIAAGALNEDGTLKIDYDGEPIPVGNEAQQKVAKAIADSFKKVKEGVVPTTDLNVELKEIIAKGQTQSAAGPKPVELAPIEHPAATPVNN